MAQLAVWLILCGIVAWALRHRPLVSMSLALTLWTLVPAVAAYRITGQEQGALGIHPSTWLLLAVAVVSVMAYPRLMFSPLAEHPIVVISVATFLNVAVITSLLVGRSGLKLLLDQAIAPVLLFWVVAAFGPTTRNGLIALRAVMIGAVSLQCLIALVERFQGRLLLYEADYATLYWYRPDRFERWLGTTDHPLILAMAICIAAPLTVGLHNSVLRVLLLSTQVVGAVITQSRVVVVAMTLVVIYLLLRGRMSALARCATAIVAGFGLYAVVSSALAVGIKSRLDDDSGSADARQSALEFFASNLDLYWFTGQGLTASYDVTRLAGLPGSFESSFVMYAVDVGLPAAAAYFGAMMALILLNWRGRLLIGAPVGALAGLLVAQTFSALAYSNLSGAFLWAAIALVVADSQGRDSDAIPTTRTRTELRPA